MHEEAVLKDLLKKVDSVARAHGVDRVASVRLWVGALSHFSERSLRERWALAAPGTVARGARLDVVVSEDRSDPRAQGVVLVSLEPVPPEPAPRRPLATGARNPESPPSP